MVFSSPIFLFGFLPIVLLATLLAWPGIRNLILLIGSLIFYAWGEGGLVVIMLISILFNYFFGLWVNQAGGKRKTKTILFLAITFNIGMLIVFKYANFLVDNLNALLNLTHVPPIKMKPIHLPIGISFFTFQSISYVLDVYRKDTPPQKNPINIALYISLFPQLIAGPIVRYHDIAKQLVNRVINVNLFTSGVKRFIIGLGKKVIIANTMAYMVDKIFMIPTESLPTSVAWLGAIAYSLQIYFDFSGYSDMAIGLGRMFGFRIPENFMFPYISQSIKEFWRRWHISLSSWFRDYLYIPLGGSRVNAKRTYMNLMIVFFVTGLWHGASWTFVIWGFCHGFFIILERVGFDRLLSKTFRPLRHLYVLLVVVVTFVMFRAENITYTMGFLKSMAGATPTVDLNYNIWLYLNHETLLIFIIAIIASTPFFGPLSRLYQNILPPHVNKFKYLRVAIQFMAGVFYFSVFLISSMSLASGTYNPFIYFRF